ncbi:MAG: peptide-methionine (S)-S-oxide reductase MsrA [Isosphaeraceae bacterium]
MNQRLLVASLGLAVALGLTGMAQAPKKSRNPAATARNAESNSTPREEPSKDNPTEEAQAKEDGSGDTKSAPTGKRPKPLERATFGGGCFWCTEAYFERIPGVTNVVSGYSGGHVPNPTYEMVCTGLTGHAEVIQIEYDPNVLSFDKLLKHFWTAHDPTTLNSQGPDFGTQYRSIILYHSDEQKEEAKKQYRELMAKRGRKSPIVTELVPFQAFYPADAYHQDYYRNHPDAAYSQTYIEPKVRKVLQKLRAEEKAKAK